MNNLSANKHADGWESDDIFRSMRRNCEAYKKIKKENEQLKLELDKLKKQLQDILKEPELKTWNDYVLFVCRDGKQRTVREIFNEIDKMSIKPWTSDAKTPCSTCSSICGDLFKHNKIYKTNDSPLKYFILI